MAPLDWLTARPIAHRGLHDGNVARWENTLAAFEAAVQRGYAIELDVHLSGDGVPVVFHDHDLKRLCGLEGQIWQHEAEELTTFAIGGTEQTIPLLTDVLDLVGGQVPLVIELKGIAGHDDALVTGVAAALSTYDGPAAIMTFYHWLVRRFAEEAPGIPAGLTAMGRGHHAMEAHFSMLAHNPDFVSYHVADLPNPFVSFVRERLGLPVISWTVKDGTGVALTGEHADQMTFEGFEP